MSALTSAAVPAVSVKRPAGNKTSAKNPVGRPPTECSDAQWEKFIGLVSTGHHMPQAMKVLKINAPSIAGYIATNKKAKQQLDDAKVLSLRMFWSEDLLEDVLVAIAMGATVNQACGQFFAEDRVSSFYKLIMRDKAVREAYDEARMIQAEKMAIDDIIEISDKTDNDETWDGKGNSAAVNRSRLMVDSRKWIASKLHYARFGDKIQQDVNANIVVDHASRLEAARKRKTVAFEDLKVVSNVPAKS